MTFSRQTCFRIAAVFLASATASCVPFLLRRWLWPDGLTAWADSIFWPASAVNLAVVLTLGPRYAPLFALNAIPAWLLCGQPPGGSLLGASTNVVEALIGAWAFRRFGRFDGAFDRVRSVVVLAVVSLVAPLVNTLLFPTYLVATGVLAPEHYPKALANWNLANAGAMLMLAPAFLMIAGGRRPPVRAAWKPETAAWVVAGLALGCVALGEVFGSGGFNDAFLLFPFVIFVALRHGTAGVAATLAALAGLIYALMIAYAHAVPAERMPAILWFLQAFCWSLAATGLLVAALLNERREADVQARESERRRLESSLREERSRLRALRYQINPHFLFNALNSLRSTLPLSADVPRGMTDALATYLRGTLEDSGGDTVSLEREIVAARSYLDIEKVRFGDDLGVEIDIADDARAASVPVFLLQPLVENAIRHGFESTKGAFLLRIAARRDGDRLRVEVENTGEWIDSGASGRTGIGLENIRRRLYLLHGDNATFGRDVSGGRVRFHIETPFIPCVAS